MMSGAAAVGLSFPEPDIGLLTIDSPGKSVNLLSRTTLDELVGLLESLAHRTDLAGVIVVSGKPGTFIAGADVRDLAARLDSASPEEITSGSQRGQAVLRRLASLPSITVAAIDGPCVGGGAELASWCDLRIVSDNPRTEIGFPEVKLGIFPGWGGTARLPRLIGLSPAVEMIRGGELIGGDAARKCGWADDVVPASELVAASIRWIRHRHATSAAAASAGASESHAAERARRAGPVRLTDGELDLLQLAAGASIDSTTGGRYPAPGEALSLLVAAAPLDIDAACRLESERFPRVFGSPVNKALVNVYFLRERIKRDSGLARDDLAPRRIERVGVVGAGIMGGGIAAAHLKCEVPVRLHDAAPESLARGAALVLDEAAYDRKLKRAEPVRRARLATLLETPAELERLAECDMVVEAIVESAEPKRQVFERLEPLLRPEAILASNTSTIPITKLADRLSRPERFCGLHFFNPVRRMTLVEVIRGAKTSDETVATAVAHAKRIGKSPIVVNDGPGFLVNRLLFPYMNEAIELLSEGADALAIDRVAKEFGMPMGPLELYDMVGIDTAMYAGRVMWEAFPDRVRASPIIPALVKAGRLGHKTGQGFFTYDHPRGTPRTDERLEMIVATYRLSERKFDDDEMTLRLFLPMLLEACRALADGIVRDARDIDFALIHGLGFPAFRGGLLFWADSVGLPRILERLKPLAELGPRMAAPPMLTELAASGGSFYGRK